MPNSMMMPSKPFELAPTCRGYEEPLDIVLARSEAESAEY